MSLLSRLFGDAKPRRRDYMTEHNEKMRKYGRIQVLCAWLPAARAHLTGPEYADQIAAAEQELAELQDWITNHDN